MLDSMYLMVLGMQLMWSTNTSTPISPLPLPLPRSFERKEDKRDSFILYIHGWSHFISFHFKSFLSSFSLPNYSYNYHESQFRVQWRLVSLYLDCSSFGLDELIWIPDQPNLRIHCPSAFELNKFIAATQKGDIVWPA